GGVEGQALVLRQRRDAVVVTSWPLLWLTSRARPPRFANPGRAERDGLDELRTSSPEIVRVNRDCASFVSVGRKGAVLTPQRPSRRGRRRAVRTSIERSSHHRGEGD